MSERRETVEVGACSKTPKFRSRSLPHSTFWLRWRRDAFKPSHFHHVDGGTHACSFSALTTHVQQVLAPSNSSTAAAVTFITFVQDLKRKTKTWGPMIELCAGGEKTLERFRYQFPDDWLYSDQLRGEWSAYNEILKRKNDSIQEQLGAVN